MVKIRSRNISKLNKKALQYVKDYLNYNPRYSVKCAFLELEIPISILKWLKLIDINLKSYNN